MKIWFQSLRMILTMTVLTGLIYPLIITVVAQAAFHAQANGSMVSYQGKITGSRLIGQEFTGTHWFHGRPSANGYDALSSGGYNLGPTNATLSAKVLRKIDNVRVENKIGQGVSIPADMVLASASGLDPDISLENALLQVPRVAQARRLDRKQVVALVMATREIPAGGFWGVEKINVLELNLALENLEGARR